ncbi:Ihnibitor of Brome mosaic virus [Pichia californica]|uniref:Enhancer of translation termination 1 n=1 Tax=Pichia californica TaxID=460514 RepID=A0A9P7BH84_9ASCO|nr:Ihnibitor of Brome mosaic virus [[Candida] californica]KAG0689148.1 Ihnibitor of Brome mosaic virus [[Candida] californica]
MGKRKLGLGKVNSKKQKLDTNEKVGSKETSNNKENKQEELLTVELTDEVNPDDPLSQLVGLWKTWKNGDRDNELILNGIINECDRILRNNIENGGKEDIKLNDNFYSIYGQALSDISKFKSDNEISDWIENSLDRIEDGFNKFGVNNIRLLFAKCNIILNKIAIQFIGKMNIDSKCEEFEGLNDLFNEFIDTWNLAMKECEKKNDFSILGEEWVFEILNVYDDLLDIVDKFGSQMNEIVDSDGEDEEEDEDEEEEEEGEEGDDIIKAKNDLLQENDFEISEDHPLYSIQNEDKYNVFWRDNMLKYKEFMGENVDKKIKKSIYEKLGQSYLMEAEDPIGFFNSFQYEGEENAEKDLDEKELKELVETKVAAEKARELGKELVNKAIEQLREAHDEEDPKTWVNIAEALITYANLLELESEEQEETYKEAEKLLRRANNACHGKYQDILDSLIVNSE